MSLALNSPFPQSKMSAWDVAKRVARNAATFKYTHYAPSLVAGFLEGGPAGLMTAAGLAGAQQAAKQAARPPDRTAARAPDPLGALGLSELAR
jgi:hypothetical protein